MAAKSQKTRTQNDEAEQVIPRDPPLGDPWAGVPGGELSM
jgi:hypothetical protein